ncbi:hypothetical protein C7S15_5936 [Burkholderia cepacia]|nr:hypothetical protein [Burkholderia cepacia]
MSADSAPALASDGLRDFALKSRKMNFMQGRHFAYEIMVWQAICTTKPF